MASAVHKKQTESKYVSCFADSRPDVDITFRDVLLSRPTDHYLVGIDNFSMTNTSLSMIEPQEGNFDALIRIVRNPASGYLDANAAPTSEAALDELFAGAGPELLSTLYIVPITGTHNYDLSIKSSEVFLNLAQLSSRLAQLASDVNNFMHDNLAGGTFQNGGYSNENDGLVPGAPGTIPTQLTFTLSQDCRLMISGSPAFWNCFSIEVPSIQNQYGLYGKHDDTTVPFTKLRRFLSMHPITGVASFDKILVTRTKKDTQRQDGEDINTYQARVAIDSAYNSRTIYGTPHYRIVKQDPPIVDFTNSPAHKFALDWTYSMFQSNACLCSTLDRRVALEVGCSLPIKNSPMVDHQKETPDFVIGRWIWRTDPRVTSSMSGQGRTFETNMPACTEYQGAQDRITYHELQAQAKIQTLRLRLFARVRSFDDATETWSMRVIALPNSTNDWWHTRLHFISKD